MLVPNQPDIYLWVEYGNPGDIELDYIAECIEAGESIGLNVIFVTGPSQYGAHTRLRSRLKANVRYIPGVKVQKISTTHAIQLKSLIPLHCNAANSNRMVLECETAFSTLWAGPAGVRDFFDILPMVNGQNAIDYSVFPTSLGATPNPTNDGSALIEAVASSLIRPQLTAFGQCGLQLLPARGVESDCIAYRKARNGIMECVYFDFVNHAVWPKSPQGLTAALARTTVREVYLWMAWSTMLDSIKAICGATL